MRRLTLGFLSASYIVLSLTVALTLWRNGGGWGAGVAALVGGPVAVVVGAARTRRLLHRGALLLRVLLH